MLVTMKIIFYCVVSEENDDVDCLQALDTYLQSSSSVVIKQQQEINDLQTLCRTLKRVSTFHILCERMKAIKTILVCSSEGSLKCN
jgi:hypothetical protein